MYRIYMMKITNLINKIQEELYEWGDIPCSCIGRLTIATLLFFPVLSINSMKSQSKPQQVVLWISMSGSKVSVERQKTQNSQHDFEKEQSQRTDPTQLQDF